MSPPLVGVEYGKKIWLLLVTYYYLCYLYEITTISTLKSSSFLQSSTVALYGLGKKNIPRDLMLLFFKVTLKIMIYTLSKNSSEYLTYLNDFTSSQLKPEWFTLHTGIKLLVISLQAARVIHSNMLATLNYYLYY